MKISEQVNPCKQKVDYWLTGDGGKRELRGMGFLLDVMETFWSSVVEMVAQCYQHSKYPMNYILLNGFNVEFYVMWNLSQYKKT